MTRTLSPLPVLGLIALSLALGAAPAAAGGVYARVDAEGSIFFTDAPSLHQSDQPGDIEGRGTAWTMLIDRPKPEAPNEETRTDVENPHRHVVPARAAGFRGLQMQVAGTLNSGVEVPFIVDTGAAVSSIPRAYLSSLGITVDPRTPTIHVRGFSGTTRVPMVDIAVVNIGGAVAERVTMVVTDNLEVGLLGMTFLQHFMVQVDATAGTVTLTRRDSDSD
jgi:clan AA aspartic protease (TIGR02281 family)